MTKVIELSALADELDDLVKRTIKGVSTVSKYGDTLYTLKPDEKEGQFCGVFIYKEHVQLVFSQGTVLDDSKGILEGKGKFRRNVNFSNSGDINTRTLVKLIKQAATLSVET